MNTPQTATLPQRKSLKPYLNSLPAPQRKAFLKTGYLKEITDPSIRAKVTKVLATLTTQGAQENQNPTSDLDLSSPTKDDTSRGNESVA